MGKIAGKRRVGRRKKSWLRNIREWTNIAGVEDQFGTDLLGCPSGRRGELRRGASPGGG
ncbi:hypothetical protein RR48_01077 [Papilio machaon]|uniref:Uncharacterized protein n=1 Tax=Papilio machaon TaxID=76193 RepID=A0A0N0PC06_PAPMA|nr:hypothetical protein RR48_01077 [Papilio machaon]